MKRWLPALFGIGLFALVLRNVNLTETWENLKLTQWGWASLAFALFILMVYFKGIRWSFLLKMQGVAYPVWDCFLIYLGSLFWGTVTPGRAGDFMKVLYLKRDRQMGFGLGMSSVLVDRVFDLYILLILGCLGLILHPIPDHPEMVHGVWAFFGILLLVTFFAFHKTTGEWLMKTLFRRVLGERFKGHADQAFQEFHQGMEAFYRPTLLWPVFLTVLAYVSFFGACGLLGLALHIGIGVLYLAFCVAVVNISSLVSFAGMGTREVTLIILFGLENHGRTEALAFSMLLFFVGTILVSVVAYLAFLLKPVKFEKSGALPQD